MKNQVCKELDGLKDELIEAMHKGIRLNPHQLAGIKKRFLSRFQMDQISEIVEFFSMGANSIEETNTALQKLVVKNKMKQSEEVSLINDYVT